MKIHSCVASAALLALMAHSTASASLARPLPTPDRGSWPIAGTIDNSPLHPVPSELPAATLAVTAPLQCGNMAVNTSPLFAVISCEGDLHIGTGSISTNAGLWISATGNIVIDGTSLNIGSTSTTFFTTGTFRVAEGSVLETGNVLIDAGAVVLQGNIQLPPSAIITVVPEPGTSTTLALGLGLLALVRRRATRA